MFITFFDKKKFCNDIISMSCENLPNMKKKIFEFFLTFVSVSVETRSSEHVDLCESTVSLPFRCNYPSSDGVSIRGQACNAWPRR